MASVLHTVSMSLDDSLYKCWSAIGVQEGLGADEDIAQFLVLLYSSLRQSDQAESCVKESDREKLGVCCVHCQSPLSLYCPSCHLPPPPHPSLPSSSSLSSSSSPVKSSSASALLSSSAAKVTSTLPSIQSLKLSVLVSSASSKSSLPSSVQSSISSLSSSTPSLATSLSSVSSLKSSSSASVVSSLLTTLSSTLTTTLSSILTSTQSSSPALSSHVLHYSTTPSSSDTATTGVQPHQTDRVWTCPPDVDVINEGGQSHLLNIEETHDSEDFSFDLDIVKTESSSQEPARLMPLNANDRSKPEVCLQGKVECVSERKTRCSRISCEQPGPSPLSTLTAVAPTVRQRDDNVKQEHDANCVQHDANDGHQALHAGPELRNTQLSSADTNCNTNNSEMADNFILCSFSDDEQCTSQRNLKRKCDSSFTQVATKPKRPKNTSMQLIKKTEIKHTDSLSRLRQSDRITETKHTDSLSRLRQSGRIYRSENTTSENGGEDLTDQSHSQDPNMGNKTCTRNSSRIQKKLSKNHKTVDILEPINIEVKCTNSNTLLKCNSDENENLQKEDSYVETEMCRTLKEEREMCRTLKEERDLSVQTKLKLSDNHSELSRKYPRMSILEEGFDIPDDVRHSAQIHVYDQSFFERHNITCKPDKHGKTQRQNVTTESVSHNTLDGNVSNLNKTNNGGSSTPDYPSLKILVSSQEIRPLPKKYGGGHVFRFYAYFECALCGKAFFQRVTFNKHLKTHTDQQLNTDVEKKVLTGAIQSRREQNKADKSVEIVQPRLSEETLRHLRDQRRKQKFECEICGKVYSSEFPLTNHMKLHTQNNGIMTCSFCPFKTCDFFVYKKHQYRCKYYKKNSSFQCDVCGVHLKSLKGLRYHIAGIHENSRPFVCSICGKCFVTQATLAFHVRTCHTEGAKRFHCDQCPACFVRRSDLHNHFISVHSTQRPFTCRFCPSAFAVRYTLDVHMRQHTGEKPYTCSECLKPFTQKSNLTQHLRLHHKGT